MPIAITPEMEIYYEVSGQGNKLLYVGGSASDLRHVPNIFQKQLPEYFEVLSYDQRGQGRTSKAVVADMLGPQTVTNYCMADYARDAIELLDGLKWETCFLIGVSFGGMVAQELAIRYSNRFTKVVLACTSSGGAGGSSYPLHELESLELREKVIQTLRLSDKRIDDTWIREHEDDFADLVETLYTNRKISVDDPKYLEGLRSVLRARADHDTYDRLSTIHIPTLICGGKYDGIAPKENLEKIAKQIPNSVLKFFEGGHMFLGQDPQALTEILTFLSGTSSSNEKL